MTRIKIIKPGTTKSQLVKADLVDFYRQYGYVPESDLQETPAPKSKKKTVSPAPAVEEEVGNDENIGE
jgi:hypothetical protein